jgi:iron complex transport system permease protein
MKTVVLILVALVAALVALLVGAVPLPLADLVRGLAQPDSRAGSILWQLRMPRVVLAFLVGGALGVSGAALQALVRNPLAEPSLLGISGGAGLAAVTAIALGVSGVWTVPLAAFAGALLAAFLVYRVATVAGARLEPRVLVLVGVVMAAFTGAIMTALLTMSDAAQLRNAFLWLLGGFGTASWQSVAGFAGYGVLPMALLLRGARSLDLISLGDEPAHALGANLESTKRLVYFTTAFLTALSVASAGLIGFVGLVAPHAMRGWVGPLHRRLLPAVFIASGSLLVVADAIARTVLRPSELPVGAVTALIGVPVFAWLLRRSLA